MININGTTKALEDSKISIENRGYKYGDALFETLKIVHGKILFWEDHYFRLMASMRLLRMEIPMNFTMEFLETQILKTIEVNELTNATARARLNIDRGNGGKYLPSDFDTISFSIYVERLDSPFYAVDKTIDYKVDLYKDHYLSNGLLSGLKTNNKIIQVIGSIYAKENNLDNCLVLNTNKNVVEALNGNLFLVKGDSVKTPPLEDGCLRGVMRKNILKILVKDVNLDVQETSISPFELQKADELFITNVIAGIQPIKQYRKKIFNTKFAEDLNAKLNIAIRLTGQTHTFLSKKKSH